jgi:hypothetical protein
MPYTYTINCNARNALAEKALSAEKAVDEAYTIFPYLPSTLVPSQRVLLVAVPS